MLTLQMGDVSLPYTNCAADSAWLLVERCEAVWMVTEPKAQRYTGPTCVRTPLRRQLLPRNSSCAVDVDKHLQLLEAPGSGSLTKGVHSLLLEVIAESCRSPRPFASG